LTGTLAWSLVLIALSAIRLGLAARYARRRDHAPKLAAPATVTVVQPILSGDPQLAACLAANVAANPQASFLWLIDDDDAEAQRITRTLAARHPGCAIASGPPPRDGENPKLAKLAHGQARVTTDILLVLDDDTVLAPGGAAALARLALSGDLVTGLPVYCSRATLPERLVSGFINGQALPTYFSMAELRANHTINGMVYALRRDDLASFGGFAAAGHELTDDYAVARLWTRHGRRLHQSRVYAEVFITFPDLGRAASVLRRWFIFANRYLSQNLGPAAMLLVILPSLLPLAGLGLAATEGLLGLLLWISVLILKAAGCSLTVRALTKHAWYWSDIPCELAADLLGPLIYLSSFVRPSQLAWRTRRIDMSDGTIRYR
jgi:ceramide glucosyltransferase